jgi:hypothetical protein
MNVVYEDSIDTEDKAYESIYECGGGYTYGISDSGGEPDGTSYIWMNGRGAGDNQGEGCCDNMT